MSHRIFLAYFIFSSCRVAGQAPTYALMGQQVNWKTDITEQPQDILWKHNGNKVVEFNGQEQQEYGSYEHRITLGWDTAELTIDNLRFEDSGVYQLEVFINNKRHSSSYELKVIDKVSKPTIKCQMDDGSDKTSGTLVCSADPGQHQSVMKYEWSSHGKVQPGPQLTISLGDKHDDEVYSCSVSNPLNSETATFTAKDCHPGGFLVPLIVSLVIISLVCLGVLIFMLWRKGKGNRNDPGSPQEEREVSQGLQHNKPGIVKDTIKVFELKKDEPKRPKDYLTKKDSVPVKPEDREETQRLLSNKDADSHQVHVEPTERNNPESDPSGREKRHGPKSDGSEEEAGKGNRNDPGSPQEEREVNQGLQHNKPGIVKDTIKVFELKKDEPNKPKDYLTKKDSVPVKPEDQESLLCNKDADSHQVHVEPTERKNPESDPSGREKRHGPKSDGSEEEAGSEKKADEEAPASPAASPTAESRSPLTNDRPPNVAPTDPAGEHKEESVSDQTLRESDSSDIPQRTNESYDPTEEKPSSADPEQEDPETSAPEPDSNLLQDETREDDPPGRDKAGCEDENKSDCVGDGDSVQPQSSTPTKPDNSNTSTLQQPADTGHDSDEPEGLSGSSTAEAYKGSEKKADEETSSAPASPAASPTAEPRSPLTKVWHPNVAPTDPAGEHKKESALNQLNNNKGNVEELTKNFEKRPEPKNEDHHRSKINPGSEKEADTPPDMPSQDPAGELKEESDSETVSAEEKQSSAVPEQEGPETSAPDSNFSQGETNTRGENQQGADKPENENKSDNVGRSDGSTAQADKGEGGEMSSADEGQKKGEDVE